MTEDVRRGKKRGRWANWPWIEFQEFENYHKTHLKRCLTWLYEMQRFCQMKAIKTIIETKMKGPKRRLTEQKINNREMAYV